MSYTKTALLPVTPDEAFAQAFEYDDAVQRQDAAPDRLALLVDDGIELHRPALATAGYLHVHGMQRGGARAGVDLGDQRADAEVGQAHVFAPADGCGPLAVHGTAQVSRRIVPAISMPKPDKPM